MRAARCDTLRRAPQNNLPVRTLFRGRRFHCGSKADGPCVHLGRHLLGPRTENCSSNLVRVGPLGGVPARPLVCCDRAGAKQLPAAATRPCGCRIAAHAACLAATAAGRTHAAPIAAELRRLTVHFAMHACMPGPGSVFAARPGRVAAKRRSPQAALTAVAGHHSLRAVPRCGLRRRGRGSPAGADQPGCARPLLPRRRGRRRSPPHGQGSFTVAVHPPSSVAVHLPSSACAPGLRRRMQRGGVSRCKCKCGCVELLQPHPSSRGRLWMTWTTSPGGKIPGYPLQTPAHNSQGLLLRSRAIVFETQGVVRNRHAYAVRLYHMH